MHRYQPGTEDSPSLDILTVRWTYLPTCQLTTARDILLLKNHSNFFSILYSYYPRKLIYLSSCCLRKSSHYPFSCAKLFFASPLNHSTPNLALRPSPDHICCEWKLLYHTNSIQLPYGIDPSVSSADCPKAIMQSSRWSLHITSVCSVNVSFHTTKVK